MVGPVEWVVRADVICPYLRVQHHRRGNGLLIKTRCQLNRFTILGVAEVTSGIRGYIVLITPVGFMFKFNFPVIPASGTVKVSA